MITLSVFDLNKMKTICEEVGTEYFAIDQTSGSGIGNILTMSYDTEIADYPAKVTIVVSGAENW